MNILLAIAAGGAIGALLRYGLSGMVQEQVEGPFPWGTISVNVIGSLLMGFCWELFDRAALSPSVRGFVIVGLLGAFTTFSTFSLETLMLAKMHDARIAFLNVLVTNIVCITAAFAGFGLGRLVDWR